MEQLAKSWLDAPIEICNMVLEFVGIRKLYQLTDCPVVDYEFNKDGAIALAFYRWHIQIAREYDHRTGKSKLLHIKFQWKKLLSNHIVLLEWLDWNFTRQNPNLIVVQLRDITHLVASERGQTLCIVSLVTINDSLVEGTLAVRSTKILFWSKYDILCFAFRGDEIIAGDSAGNIFFISNKSTHWYAEDLEQIHVGDQPIYAIKVLKNGNLLIISRNKTEIWGISKDLRDNKYF
jgi:hypothetical protein